MFGREKQNRPLDPLLPFGIRRGMRGQMFRRSDLSCSRVLTPCSGLSPHVSFEVGMDQKTGCDDKSSTLRKEFSMKTASLREWTYEEFMSLPEGGPYRYEIIDGELCMTVSPSQTSRNFWKSIRNRPAFSSFESPRESLSRSLRRGFFQRSDSGGRTGPALCLERAFVHHY